MTKICDFGKEIKKKLVDINQSQECLIQEVKKETGLYFDSGCNFTMNWCKIKLDKYIFWTKGANSFKKVRIQNA